jgi:hypothetical protein
MLERRSQLRYHVRNQTTDNDRDRQMSSQQNEAPGYRLVLGYPDVVLFQDGVEAPLCTARLDDVDGARSLRALADAAGGGRMRVILPEAEIWRGSIQGRPGDLLRRRRRARHEAATAMRLPPSALVLSVGARRPDGSIPLAAARRATVRETCGFLARYGLSGATIACDDAMPGFRAPPAAASLDPIRSAGRPLRLAALGGAASVAALLLLALPGDEIPSPGAPQAPRAVAELTPEPQPDQPPRPEPTLAAALQAAPPAHRPAPLAAADRVAAAPAARTADPEPAPQPAVTKASRNLPAWAASELPAYAPRPLAQVPATAIDLPDSVFRAASLTDADISPAYPEPTGDRVASVAPRPLHRPADRQPVPAPEAVAATAAPAPAGPAPRPRPSGIAAAETRDEVGRAVAGAVAAASQAAPVAVPVAFVAPQPRRLAQTPTRAVTFQPQPAPVIRAAPPAPARAAAPAPVQPASAAPVRVAAAQPAPAASRSARAPREQDGLQRNAVSLVGIFGSAEHRRAILRLPNGQMQKVRPGDRVQGTQVAAVGTDTVRLTGGGRDTLLRLSD